MKLNINQSLYLSEIQGWKHHAEDGGRLINNKKNRLHLSCCRRPFVISVAIFTMLVSVIIIHYLTLFGTSDGSLPDKVISCYYNTPDKSTNASQQLLPSQIHPHLCTHINVAFARVVQKQIYLEQSQYEALREVVNLKRANSQLKVLVSVGGAGENNGFSEMVKNHASRKIFIKSIKSILRNYSLDGIDLDWEFPALHIQQNHLAARERQHFSQLLREIRMEYMRENRDYLLTVALAAPQIITDISYDVDQINLYVDFANIMTYDFHYFTKYTPFTGLNSPLYPRLGEELYPATLNINYTVKMYETKGLDLNKIVVGIPTYAHTFELVNENNPNIGSPASGPGSLGDGSIGYPEVCAFLARRDATQHWEEAARVPYAYRGREWLSFDSPRSVTAKAQYIKARGLGGAMLYSLNADDYAGRCGARGPAAAFPLAQAVSRVLLPHEYSLTLNIPFSSLQRR